MQRIPPEHLRLCIFSQNNVELNFFRTFAVPFYRISKPNKHCIRTMQKYL